MVIKTKTGRIVRGAGCTGLQGARCKVQGTGNITFYEHPATCNLQHLVSDKNLYIKHNKIFITL